MDGSAGGRLTGEAALLGALGSAARGIGAPGFHETLLELVHEIVPAERRQIVRYAMFDPPEMWASTGICEELIVLYLKAYHETDPFLRHWRRHASPGVVTLHDTLDPDSGTALYTDGFMPRAGYIDEVAIMLPWLGGATVALFLERTTRDFASREVGRLRAIYPALEGLNHAHLRCLTQRLDAAGAERLGLGAGSPVRVIDARGLPLYENGEWRAALEAEPAIARAASELAEREPGASIALGDGLRLHRLRLSESGPPEVSGAILLLERRAARTPPLEDPGFLEQVLGLRLTPRECDIIRLVLSGHPTARIARRLGLSVGTVRNYRHRLYEKLDITTERELLGLFINSAALGRR